MRNLSLFEQLQFTTTMVECKSKEGKTIGAGTGFLFRYDFPGNRTVVALITNKHVIEKCDFLEVEITIADNEGFPIKGKTKKFAVSNCDELCIPHPSPTIDVCAIPINVCLHGFFQDGNNPFYRTFNMNNIPDDNILQDLDVVEDIYMIGYPLALMDRVNHLPIIRKGITATDCRMDYNGKPEFLLDLPCYDGSSGSPVIICNEGTYKTKDSITLGTRFHLIGIEYSAYQNKISVVKEGIVDSKDEKSSVPVSINLGLAINSKVLRDFIPLMENYYDKFLKPLYQRTREAQ